MLERNLQRMKIAFKLETGCHPTYVEREKERNDDGDCCDWCIKLYDRQWQIFSMLFLPLCVQQRHSKPASVLHNAHWKRFDIICCIQRMICKVSLGLSCDGWGRGHVCVSSDTRCMLIYSHGYIDCNLSTNIIPLVANEAGILETYSTTFITCKLTDFWINDFPFPNWTASHLPNLLHVLQRLSASLNFTLPLISFTNSSFLLWIFYMAGGKRFFSNSPWRTSLVLLGSIAIKHFFTHWQT